MPRPARSKLSPFIESLILSYGGEEVSCTGRLKANVIGVGQMTLSQARDSMGPTGLLFLSDGLLQIPAILTTAAWEHLQEQEDRECFTSLLNTTVCIQDYQLLFHMTPEQTKCRFFLSVGELATTSVGPVKVSTPCCTTLPSVRQKICKTWRVLLGQEEDSQRSQCGFDLSELLGEWQHNCLQGVLEDVRERLVIKAAAGSRPESSPQPSTSAYTATSALIMTNTPDTFTTTSTTWDVDRVKYKGEKCFTVPKCLLVQEVDSQELETPQTVGSVRRPGPAGLLPAPSEDNQRDLPPACVPSEATQPSVEDVEWQIIAKPAAAAATVADCYDHNMTSPHPSETDSLIQEHVVIAGMMDGTIRPLSNPWDMFPPPGDTSPSASEESPVATPTHQPMPPLTHNPPHYTLSSPGCVALLTGEQLPVHTPTKESQQQLTSEQSYLQPYQRPQVSASISTTGHSSSSPPSSASPPKAFTTLSNLSPIDEQRPATDAPQPDVIAVEQEGQNLEEEMEEDIERKPTNAKRKRRDSALEEASLVNEEEEETLSPPSWLYDTQAEAGSGVEEESSSGSSSQQQQGPIVGSVLRQTPTVHSDGGPFSYSYPVSGQVLQDLSRFKVTESWLHWAVKYLVHPKQTENTHNVSLLSSNQSDSEVTSLQG